MNSTITHSQMVAQLAKPGEAILKDLTPYKVHLWHMITGIGGEFLEISIALDNDDRQNFVEEAGDYLFYLQGIYHLMPDPNMPVVTWHQYPTLDKLRFSFAVYSEQVVDIVKKHVLYNKPLKEAELLEAMQNALRVLAMIANHFGIKISTILTINMNKLLTGANARYAAGSYSDEAAQLRADKVEEQNNVLPELEPTADVNLDNVVDEEPGKPLEADDDGRVHPGSASADGGSEEAESEDDEDQQDLQDQDIKDV